jgi:hypothetical protein
LSSSPPTTTASSRARRGRRAFARMEPIDTKKLCVVVVAVSS